MLTKTVCANLQRKLCVVYFLNVVDWICTLRLVSTGLFYEANPLAAKFIDSIGIGFLVKCAVPLLLVVIVCKGMHILDLKALRFADMLISFGLTIYLLITLDHFINFILLLQNRG